MRQLNILAAINATIAAGFFNSHAGFKLFVCATAQPDDLSQAEFEALTWVQVGGVGSHGETGTNTNILTYDTWDTDVVQKAKGMSNAGDPEIEVARDPDDAGQVILRTAAGTNFNYAFKITANDKPNNDVDSEPTTRYNRGLVTGPRQPHGRNEDFDLEIFGLALQQRQITVDPIDGTAP
jgi:hypothetical protein